MPSTEGATSVFWSPDGTALGFVVPGAMKRVALEGGPAVTICPLGEAGGRRPASWGPDGRIVFSSVLGEALLEVASAGASLASCSVRTGEEASSRSTGLFTSRAAGSCSSPERRTSRRG